MIPEWSVLPAGIVIAALANMVGIGGGILWMPFLIFVMKLEPATAVMTSLIIQIAGMGSGAVTVLWRKRVDVRLALIMSAAALPGVVIGFSLRNVLTGGYLIFLLGMASMAAALVFVAIREDYDFSPRDSIPVKAVIPYLWAPSLLSVLTGLLSTGIGDFMVPILRTRLRLRMDVAIGTCLVVMTVNAAVATALYASEGADFSAPAVVFGVLGVIAGGQIGPRLAHRIPDQILKEVFIYGLALVGIHMLFNA